MIFIRYSGHKEENRHYVDIAKVLAASGVRVPGIFLHDPAEGLILMEDLGGTDLWQFRNVSWERRQKLYQSALDQILLLHTQATKAFPCSGVRLQKEFNEDLYLWEQDYFFENCLEGFFKIPADQLRSLRELPALRVMARHLSTLPRVLVHRDFQSQNVLLRGDQAWLIDFQGLRPGLPHYDLASLLYDPYVSFADEERAALANYYRDGASGLDIARDFEEILRLCAIQRLMQALGAYGFLGLKKGKPRFLDFIPIAGRLLQEVMAPVKDMMPLGDCLACCAPF